MSEHTVLASSHQLAISMEVIQHGAEVSIVINAGDTETSSIGTTSMITMSNFVASGLLVELGETLLHAAKKITAVVDDCGAYDERMELE